MNMNEVIARINELAKKAKTAGLTPEELAERDKLRRIYIDSVKGNLIGQLENTYLVRPDGTKEKLDCLSVILPLSPQGFDSHGITKQFSKRGGAGSFRNDHFRHSGCHLKAHNGVAQQSGYMG